MASIPDGTTDITRTVAIGDPGADIRRLFTLVLKGHIALDQARVSPTVPPARNWMRWPASSCGVRASITTTVPGTVWACFSVCTRRRNGSPRLLQRGRAATGHDQSAMSRAITADGAFGMRCENLLVVRESESTQGETPMLEFEALTLVPFDTRLLDTRLMSAAELAWLNRYHQRVAADSGPAAGRA